VKKFLIASVVSLIAAGSSFGQFPVLQSQYSSVCPNGQCQRPVIQAVADTRQAVGNVFHSVGNVVQGQPVFVQQTADCPRRPLFPRLARLLGR
jgi:hypothetical protein